MRVDMVELGSAFAHQPHGTYHVVLSTMPKPMKTSIFKHLSDIHRELIGGRDSFFIFQFFFFAGRQMARVLKYRHNGCIFLLPKEVYRQLGNRL